MTRDRSGPRPGGVLPAAGAVLLLLVAAPLASAQVENGNGGEEIRLLREAQSREQRGDLAAASEIMRQILDERSTALSALLGLERVLRMQGRMEEVLPYVGRLLEHDPESAIGHQMALRTLSSLNRVEEMEAAADAWIRATPDRETPYREIAQAWESRGALDRAVAVLERGRDRLGGGALAMELGSLYSARGDVERAAAEWSRAIGPDGRGLQRVRRRASSLPDGGARVIPALVDALLESDATLARKRAAAELAIDAGLAERAEMIARDVASELEGAELENFLVEVARRSDSIRLHRMAYWAYGQLLETEGPERRLLAIRERVADLALAIGDTTVARRHYAVIEDAYDEGSPARRQAAALRIELTVRDGSVDRALEELETFREQYPDAPELDELTAVTAGALLQRGELDRAQRILADVDGPHSGMLRSHLALQNGDVGAARNALLTAAPGLKGAEATQAIDLATLLGELSEKSATLVGDALEHVVRGTPQAGVELLLSASNGLTAEESAAVLGFAAETAHRAALPAEADRIRRTLIDEYPRADEAPEALLELARSLSERLGGVEEARELLRRLIVDYPDSALVPQARRELNRLEQRIPNS